MSFKYKIIYLIIMIMIFVLGDIIRVPFEPSKLAIVSIWFVLYPIIILLFAGLIFYKRRLNKRRLYEQRSYGVGGLRWIESREDKLLITMGIFIFPAILTGAIYLYSKLFAYYFSNEFEQKVNATSFYCIRKGSFGYLYQGIVDLNMIDMTNNLNNSISINHRCSYRDTTHYSEPKLFLVSGRQSFWGKFYDNFRIISP